MYRGYIKLWRKSLDSNMLKNPNLWTFWTWCLLKASHAEKKVIIGFQEVILKPGEFIFGRLKAASESNMTERCIRTCIKTLKKLENVTIKVTNKFSVITITNWDNYQSNEIQNDQQNAQPATSQRPASDQQVTTNKNDKNVKNDKNNNPPTPLLNDKSKENNELNNGDITVKKPSNKKKVFKPPTCEEVVCYFKAKGYSELAAKKAHEYYETADWHDSKGNKVHNWKQKMIAVWFTEENKIQQTVKFYEDGSVGYESTSE